jgi:hypothetical protein
MGWNFRDSLPEYVERQGNKMAKKIDYTKRDVSHSWDSFNRDVDQWSNQVDRWTKMAAKEAEEQNKGA